VSFEARFVPDPGSPGGDLGLGLVDARGYDATQSAMTINGIGPEWKAFRDMYHAEHDTKAIVLQARLAFGTAKSSGRYEVRNLQIEAVSAPVFPAYPLLTACAMLSEDGKTLHLIVFNKSTAQDISAQIDLAHFHAASARLWEVNGPTLGAVTGVAETVHGDPLDMSGVGPVHLFPAHSMTAIDFVAQANPQNP
jgi:alpha-N-arabinofuranosidase